MAKQDKNSTPAKRPSGSSIRPCKCKNEYQEAHYGKGMRVFTVGGSKDVIKYSCTSCERTEEERKK